MKRTINATGRKRITHELVSFELLRDASGRPCSFKAELTKLAELKLAPEARVVVEAVVRHSSIRFEFGTVGNIVPPANCGLQELDVGGGDVLFRVKVIGESGHIGRLLAAGDRFPETVPVEVGEQRKPLLPVKQIPLQERIWKVEVTSGARPLLCVNSNIPNLADALRKDPLLKGAVLPEAFRQVLQAMLQENSDALPWYDDWCLFLTSELGLRDPQELEEDEEQDYVDDAVDVFVTKFKFATRAMPAPEPAEELPYD
jgi:hypothetical protein